MSLTEMSLKTGFWERVLDFSVKLCWGYVYFQDLCQDTIFTVYGANQKKYYKTKLVSFLGLPPPSLLDA